MKKVLLIHGYNGSPDGIWIPWLKKILEEKGFKVFAPHLPGGSLPSLEEETKTIKRIISKFGKKDSIITHSKGAVPALHAILENNKKLKSLLLFAPVLTFEYFNPKFIEKSERTSGDSQRSADNWKNMTTYWTKTMDVSQTSRLVPVTAIFSNDDPIADPAASALVPKDWSIEHWDNCKHFWRTEEPQLLELALKNI
ncbi:MAG: alpha/beta hydrolase [Candidatus Paceibacterota bacterium]|jgi:predicted alpha/beta hydrolase family esterase